jgi:hypothetical protein
MLLVRRFIPYLLGFLIVAGMLLAAFVPVLIWPLFGLLAFLILLAIWTLSDNKFNLDFLNSVVTPLVFYSAVFLFTLFLESMYFKALFPFIVAFLLFVYTEQLFYYRYFDKKYQPNSLENLSFYMVILSIFFLSSSLFGFYIFLHAPKVALLIGVTLVTLLLNYQLFWVMKVNFWESWPYNLVLTLAVFEFFFVLTFLPTSFAVNGAMLAILYYFTLGLLRYHFIDRLDIKVIKRYLIIGGLMLMFVAFTARWT